MSEHQILVDLPGLDRLMAQPAHTLNLEPVQYSLLTRVFGGVDTPELKEKMVKSIKELGPPIERLFLNEAAATAAVERAGIGEHAASFVTFCTDPGRMKRWELSSNVQVVKPDSPGSSGMVEADLQSLVRDFGFCMAVPQLYGKDFLERNPELLNDFWKFDNDLFPLLMIGMPSWAPLNIIREGRASRSRLMAALETVYRQVDKVQQGEPADPEYDVSDVSFVLFEKNKIFARDGWSLAERAVADMPILWGQNANTQPLLFWFLTYAYSTPGLISRIRKEIAPFVKLSDTNPRCISSLDIHALAKTCPLLKSTVFETYRLTDEAASIRYLERPITIKDGSLTHSLKQGTWISVPHSVTSHDASVFAEPEKFIPERFLETDSEGRPVARYGRLRPWGAGAAMCKGRTFAEREILAVGAAIISLWDIEQVGGTWRLPDMIPGTGVKKPVKDIRVRITRRCT
ncbi:uncharacterized protein E0L32_010712 [Thyridium curvatum]|uniref:Cytochrome P450 n=1 Tax=Thyridium curvatum TaxID=1093900 RepID=A0A507AJU6_9PEZI|nr:uncharacterized protein E0L32_010712 [Thyridium curvatum]TPX07613.1 hypothetical protein E0L32_010712 [Thyridium curvatum]